MCTPAAQLLVSEAVLPEDTFGLGPVWLERWADVPEEEAFRFDVLIERHGEGKNRLIRAWRRMAATRDLPRTMRRAA